jgi:hypothetical protein
VAVLGRPGAQHREEPLVADLLAEQFQDHRAAEIGAPTGVLVGNLRVGKDDLPER